MNFIHTAGFLLQIYIMDYFVVRKSAYAVGRPCSVGSSPLISSSSDTLSPIVFLMIRNTMVIVTAVHAATAANPSNWMRSG